MRRNGKLIVIEGGDGAGKATQTKMLIEHLEQDGLATATLDFPQYQTASGQMIRAYLDGQFGKATDIDPIVAGTLYALNRLEERERLQRWLREGKVVVLDRYWSANIIHQGAKCCLDQSDEIDLSKFSELIALFWRLEFQLFRIPKPDLIIYLNVHPQTSQNLIKKRGRKADGHEADRAYAAKVAKLGIDACLLLGWTRIDCNHPARPKILTRKAIHERIWQIVQAKLFQPQPIQPTTKKRRP